MQPYADKMPCCSHLDLRAFTHALCLLYRNFWICSLYYKKIMSIRRMRLKLGKVKTYLKNTGRLHLKYRLYKKDFNQKRNKWKQHPMYDSENLKGLFLVSQLPSLGCCCCHWIGQEIKKQLRRLEAGFDKILGRIQKKAESTFLIRKRVYYQDSYYISFWNKREA